MINLRIFNALGTTLQWKSSDSFFLSCSKKHGRIYQWLSIRLLWSHSSFLTFLFSLPPPQMCTQAQLWLCHQSIITNLNMKIFYLKMIMAPIIICKKIHVILSECDNLIENIQIHMSQRSLFFSFFFFGLIFCINVKNKYEKRRFDPFF